MITIYIAWADTNYEGSSAMRAFVAKPDADAFIAECQAHADKQPPCPSIDSPDEEWELWHEARAQWEKAAPPDFLWHDGYSVTALELHGELHAQVRES